LAFGRQIHSGFGRGAEQQGDGGPVATRPATVEGAAGLPAGLAGVADCARSGKRGITRPNDERRIIAELEASPR